MAIVDTDWNVFLSAKSDLPPDVYFLVPDGEEGGNSFKTIKAHKLLLAGVSLVFRAQFFGPMKDEREVIEVQDTTAEAFQAMVDFIYRKAGKNTLTLDEIGDPQALFQLLEISERYQVRALKVLVEEVIKKIELTRENMMFAATVANNYKVQFEEISLAVSKKCVQFLDKTTRNSDDVFSLVEDTLKYYPGASFAILLELKKVKDMMMPGNLTYSIL